VKSLSANRRLKAGPAASAADSPSLLGADDLAVTLSAADPDAHLFPRHKVGVAGDKRTPYLYDIDSARPAGEWKSAWRAVCARAGVSYRWHDLRHSS
jgi:hypothetical protein